MAEEGLTKTDNDLIHIGKPIPFDTDERTYYLQQICKHWRWNPHQPEDHGSHDGKKEEAQRTGRRIYGISAGAHQCESNR